MEPFWWTTCLVMIPGVLLASWIDFSKRKVPNWLNASLILLGFIAQGYFNGLGGVESGALGLLVGFGVLIVPWLMHGMGAGDVGNLHVLSLGRRTQGIEGVEPCGKRLFDEQGPGRRCQPNRVGNVQMGRSANHHRVPRTPSRLVDPGGRHLDAVARNQLGATLRVDLAQGHVAGDHLLKAPEVALADRAATDDQDVHVSCHPASWDRSYFTWQEILAAFECHRDVREPAGQARRLAGRAWRRFPKVGWRSFASYTETPRIGCPQVTR